MSLDLERESFYERLARSLERLQREHDHAYARLLAVSLARTREQGEDQLLNDLLISVEAFDAALIELKPRAATPRREIATQ